jgi:type IV pilus assembly protein PilA
MKKLLKNAKGLTLVELLAVIVILGIIAAIAVPSIGGIIENSREKADTQTVSLIESAAILYAMEEELTAASTTVDVVDDLIGRGYLTGDSAPLNQVTGGTYETVTVSVNATTGAITATIGAVTPPED